MLLCSAVIAGSKRGKITPKWGGQENTGQSSALPALSHDAPWVCRLDTTTKGISSAVRFSPGVIGAMPLALWRKDKTEI